MTTGQEHEKDPVASDFKRVEVDRNQAMPHFNPATGNPEWIARGLPLLGRDRKLHKVLAAGIVTQTGEQIKAEDRIFGELSRSFPADVMQKVYSNFIDWAHNLALDPDEQDPESRPSNLMFVMSGPGIGKTHLSKVIARAFGYRNTTISAGEGSGNIDELVIEYVYETNDKRGTIPFHEVTAQINRQLVRLAKKEASGSEAKALEALYDDLNKIPGLLQPHADIDGGVPGKKAEPFYTLNDVVLAGREEILSRRNELAKMSSGDRDYPKKKRELYVLETPNPNKTKSDADGEPPLTPAELELRKVKDDAFDANHKRIVEEVIGGIIQRHGGVLGMQGVTKHGNGSGIRQKNGRVLQELIRIEQEYKDNHGKAVPTIITIDEFNRYTNFGKKLQNFWEVVGGSSKENVEITDADGEKHVFTPDMLKHVFVYLTGNDPAKVPQANELDESMMSRLGFHAIKLDDFKPEDWQHRFEQILTGMGLGIHYRADEDYWKSHPDEFAQHIRTKRVEGLSQLEKAKYIAHPMQSKLIGYDENAGNAPNVMAGLRQVGQFMAEWAEIYLKGDAPTQRELSAMPMRPTIDPRLVTYILNDIRKSKATSASGEAQRQGGGAWKPTVAKAEDLGDKLIDTVKRMVTTAHEDIHSPLRAKLAQSMWKNGLINEEEFGELTGIGKGEQKKTDGLGELRKHASAVTQVRKLLNYDRGKDYDQVLKPLHIILRDVALETIPGLSAKTTPDNLIDIHRLEEFITRVTEHDAELAKDLDGKGTIGGGQLPPTLSRILLPMVFKDKKGYSLDLVPTLLVDGVTRVEQLGKGKPAKDIADGIAAAKNKDATLTSTTQILAGLAWPNLSATTRHEQIMHLFMSGTGQSIEAALASARLKVAEADLAKAPADKRAAAQARVIEIKATHANAMAALAPGHEKTHATPWFKDAELMAGHEHPSGLAATVVHTANNKSIAGGHDSLSVMTVSYNNPAKANKDAPDKIDRTLIVGFSEQSPQMLQLLKNHQITYVRMDPNNKVAVQDTITKELGFILAIARDNLKAADDKHPDKTETAGSGLLFHLEQGLNIRTPDSFDATREQSPKSIGDAGADKAQEDLYMRRLKAVAEHLTDERNLPTKATVNPVHATQLSYTDKLKMKQAEQPLHDWAVAKQ